jgi:hypothetical protein
VVAAPISDIAVLLSDDFQMVDHVGYDVVRVRRRADEAARINDRVLPRANEDKEGAAFRRAS